MIEQVKTYFDNLDQWKSELIKIREIILTTGLIEDYKWRNPCFTLNDKNIVLIGYTKEHCLVSFFKGELLSDPKNMLQKAGPNSRSAKYISFKTSQEIDEKASFLKDFISQATVIEKKGLKVEFALHNDLEYPEELLAKFKENPAFENAFNQLTKGRQRGYLLHFYSAKQPQTRTTRINKYQHRILDGKGMLDCVCGLSKRMPNCDGSHKAIK